MSINRVCISGNLTRDPELRSTQGGTSVLSFGVAVNDRRQNPQTGEWEDYPNFVDCTLFGKRAEGLSDILTKGMKVGIEGKLRYSSWERDGQKRSKLEVIVDEVELMTVRDGSQQQRRQAYQQPYGQQAAYRQQAQARPQAARQAARAPYPQHAASYPTQAASAPYPAPQPATAAPAPPPMAYPQATYYQRQTPPAPQVDVYDEDIPF